jgi:hypothetical protein
MGRRSIQSSRLPTYDRGMYPLTLISAALNHVQDDVIGLKRAFHETPYIGHSVRLLVETLTDYNHLFTVGPVDKSKAYYAKFISIVQSSGLGKTKLIYQVWVPSFQIYEA